MAPQAGHIAKKGRSCWNLAHALRNRPGAKDTLKALDKSSSYGLSSFKLGGGTTSFLRASFFSPPSTNELSSLAPIGALSILNGYAFQDPLLISISILLLPTLMMMASFSSDNERYQEMRNKVKEHDAKSALKIIDAYYQFPDEACKDAIQRALWNDTRRTKKILQAAHFWPNDTELLKKRIIDLFLNTLNEEAFNRWSILNIRGNAKIAAPEPELRTVNPIVAREVEVPATAPMTQPDVKKKTVVPRKRTRTNEGVAPQNTSPKTTIEGFDIDGDGYAARVNRSVLLQLDVDPQLREKILSVIGSPPNGLPRPADLVEASQYLGDEGLGLLARARIELGRAYLASKKSQSLSELITTLLGKDIADTFLKWLSTKQVESLPNVKIIKLMESKALPLQAITTFYAIYYPGQAIPNLLQHNERTVTALAYILRHIKWDSDMGKIRSTLAQLDINEVMDYCLNVPTLKDPAKKREASLLEASRRLIFLVRTYDDYRSAPGNKNKAVTVKDLTDRMEHERGKRVSSAPTPQPPKLDVLADRSDTVPTRPARSEPQKATHMQHPVIKILSPYIVASNTAAYLSIIKVVVRKVQDGALKGSDGLDGYLVRLGVPADKTKTIIDKLINAIQELSKGRSY